MSPSCNEVIYHSSCSFDEIISCVILEAIHKKKILYLILMSTNILFKQRFPENSLNTVMKRVLGDHNTRINKLAKISSEHTVCSLNVENICTKIKSLLIEEKTNFKVLKLLEEISDVPNGYRILRHSILSEEILLSFAPSHFLVLENFQVVTLNDLPHFNREILPVSQQKFISGIADLFQSPKNIYLLSELIQRFILLGHSSDTNSIKISCTSRSDFAILLRKVFRDVFKTSTTDELLEKCSLLRHLIDVLQHGVCSRAILTLFVTDFTNSFCLVENGPVLDETFKDHFNWTYKQIVDPIKLLILQLLASLDLDSVMTIITGLISNSSVNWKMVLMFVSVVAVGYKGAIQGLQTIARELLANSLSTQSKTGLTASLLLARHSLAHAPNPSSAYDDWWKTALSKQDPQARTKRSAEQISSLLTELLPWEMSSSFLRVHLASPSWLQSAIWRVLQVDYQILARSRLDHLKINGQCLDTLIFANTSKMKEQIDSILGMYQSSGRIPNTLLEMAMFRQRVYLEEFLPLLLNLQAPVLEQYMNSRKELIVALTKAGKIPEALIDTYK